ncbi:MAG: hypothetical protein ACLS9F_13865 [Clostridium paraputrificum]
MASEGWIKLHRCVRSNWVWNDKPFNRGSAWLDLLMLVNHQDKKIIFNGILTNVEKGSCITSLRKLSERWGWSISKTKRFFEQLQDEKMLSFKSDTKKTLVTIENWDLYQCSETEIVTPKENKSKTEEKQKETNKNEENDKNDKEVYIDLKFVDEVIEKVKLTQEQYNKLINKYDKEYVHKEILGLDNYIVNGKGAKYKDHYRTLNTWLRTRKAPAPKEDRHYGFNG